ncbi:MAG: Rieske 2Fe-2S domain-containing protein [Bryobacteraceae bacterium]
MAENALLTSIEQQDWLQPGAERTSELIRNTFQSAGERGQTVKNALHGVWLGHPLHPAITDVPVGSWTVAAALDLLEIRGDSNYQSGADFAVLLGLLTAVPAAITGATDWSDTQGKPQRVGAVHGMLNLGAATLYAGSLAARRAERRGIGKALGFLGFGLVLISAYLGGELSYTRRVGVNHAPDVDEELPKEYTVAIAESELVQGEPKKVNVAGTDVFFLKTATKLYALANKCSHMGGPLAEGKVEGDSVICPWHGSRFCLGDGRVEDGPATNNQPVFDVKIEAGNVLIRARQA